MRFCLTLSLKGADSVWKHVHCTVISLRYRLPDFLPRRGPQLGQRFPSLSPRGPTLAMHGPTWGHAWPFMAKPWPCHGHAWACPAGLAQQVPWWLMLGKPMTSPRYLYWITDTSPWLAQYSVNIYYVGLGGGLGVREGVLFNSIKNFLRLFRRCLIK